MNYTQYRNIIFNSKVEDWAVVEMTNALFSNISLLHKKDTNKRILIESVDKTTPFENVNSAQRLYTISFLFKNNLYRKEEIVCLKHRYTIGTLLSETPKGISTCGPAEKQIDNVLYLPFNILDMNKTQYHLSKNKRDFFNIINKVVSRENIYKIKYDHITYHSDKRLLNLGNNYNNYIESSIKNGAIQISDTWENDFWLNN